MSTPIADFIRAYYRQRIPKSKSTLFHFQGTILYMGKCEIAILKDKLLVLNETIDMPEVNNLRARLIEIAKEFRVTPILIPLNWGIEVIPSDEEVLKLLENRLLYWHTNQQELTNNKIRGQYTAYYEQFKKFLYQTTHEKPNSQLQTFYKQIRDKKYMKALQLQVARRKANLK